MKVTSSIMTFVHNVFYLTLNIYNGFLQVQSLVSFNSHTLTKAQRKLASISALSAGGEADVFTAFKTHHNSCLCVNAEGFWEITACRPKQLKTKPKYYQVAQIYA